MNIPGFTAESSLEGTIKDYRAGTGDVVIPGAIVPAACIGAFGICLRTRMR